MNKKNVVSKISLVAILVTALFVVPANSDLIFGYGSFSSPSAPTCNNQKPGNAPVLFSATSTSNNSITLNWSGANNPVSYYLVTFGTKPGEQLYGNPNVGGPGTTSYTIGNLSGGKTYYFKVRAGNGCMPGDYSNEVSGSATGGFVSGVPGGFAPGVLGASTKISPTVAAQISPSVAPTIVPAPKEMGFWEKIWSLIKKVFGK